MKPTKLFLLLAPFFVATYAAAADSTRGSVEIIGHGESTSAPEFATMSVSVVSICYNTSLDAKNANATLANKIVTLFQGHRHGSKDKVIATGGVNVRETEYVDTGSSTRKVLCERKWKATNQITLETSELKMIPDIQDEVLKAIDEVDDVRPDKTDQTYAQLAQPGFSVYPETMQRLRKEAESKAWDDAKGQYDGFASKCDFQDSHLTSIAPPTYAYPHFSDSPAPAHGGKQPETPILPDELSVQATWKFIWTYTPGGHCLQIM